MKKSLGWFAPLLVVLAGSTLIWLLFGRPTTGIDDADIFLVYARNFAEGHGWVYNPGGERVEGFTSMLWVLLCSGFALFFQALEAPLLGLNLLLGTGTLAICLRQTRRKGLFLILLAAAPAWFAWCQVSLMESGLWCLLLTLTVLAVVNGKCRSFIILLPLLVLTRPESMLWGAWLILLFGFRNGFKTALVPLGVFVLSLVALTGFRLGYFGYPLPNTYYAKVSTDLFSNIWNGLGYFGRYLVHNPAVFVVLACWVVVLVRRRGFSDRSFLMALALLPGIGIPVLVGGDHFGAFRFYQPIWPLLCLLAALEWPAVSKGWKQAVPLALLLFGWMLFPTTANLKHEFRIAREGRETGRVVQERFGAKAPTVAVITAGGFKYTYPGEVFDLMGLNSTEMAHAPGRRGSYKNHSAFHAELFYRWYPDILLCGDSFEFDSLVLNGLHSEPRFLERYEECVFEHNGRPIHLYLSRRFLAR